MRRYTTTSSSDTYPDSDEDFNSGSDEQSEDLTGGEYEEFEDLRRKLSQSFFSKYTRNTEIRPRDKEYESLYLVETRPDIEAMLKDSLTDLENQILNTIFENSKDSLLFGGAIRDAILQRRPTDLDLYVPRTQLKKVLDALNRTHMIRYFESNDYVVGLYVDDVELNILTGDTEVDISSAPDFSINLLFYHPDAKFGIWTGSITSQDGTKITVDQVIDDIQNMIARQVVETEEIDEERLSKVIKKGFQILN